MNRPPGSRAVATLGLLLLLGTGCGDSGAGAGGGGDRLDPAALVLRTDTRGEDAFARAPFSVDCRLFRRAGAGPLSEEVGEELSLPGPATVVVVDGPAPPRSILGSTLVLGAAGEYRVACELPTLGLQDKTPAWLPVVPGRALAATIRTRLWHQVPGQGRLEVPAPQTLEARAGLFADVTCEGRDEAGNPIDAGWKLSVLGPAPPELRPAIPFRLIRVGSISVRCGTASGAGDKAVYGPARAIRVTVGPPKQLYARLDPPAIAAGDASELSCRATDAFDNPVKGFPFSVSHSDKVALKGLYISSTVAGVHAVKCVPESLPWKLFAIHPALLTVSPGPPASLQVARVPDQGVYQRKTELRFHPLVRDDFGNIVGDAAVTMAVTEPKSGFSVLADTPDDRRIRFLQDGTYQVSFEVTGTALNAVSEVLIDGAPPLLTIDHPLWGSTLTLKPSIQLKGRAGDEGAGIKDLLVNGLKVYPDAADEWFLQVGAHHGLNPVLAVATDLGGQQSRATRGFYYSDTYYPTDAAAPEAHLVPGAVKLWLSCDFFDDGDHDPAKPDDLATLIELVAAGMPLSSILPPNLNSNGADITLSDAKMGKPAVALECREGGLGVRVRIVKLSVDVKVRAKLKLGPIHVSLGASGTFRIDSLRIRTRLALGVQQGKATAVVQSSEADIQGMTFDIDGLGKLLNPVANALLGTFKGKLEKTLADQLQKELPKVFQQLFDALAVNDTFEVDPLIPGKLMPGKDQAGKPAKITLTLASRVRELKMSPKGAMVHLDMGFSSARAVPHKVLGAIGRGGCVGVEPDGFQVDEQARLQLAVHDDLLNQLLYALWYGGAFSGVIGPGTLANQEGSGIPLETATITVDPLLPPILEGCPQVSAFHPGGKIPADFDPMHLRLQLGDAMGALDLYSNGLVKLYVAAQLELGLGLAYGKDAEGQPEVLITPDKTITELHELVGLSKQLQEGKWAWIKAIDGLFASLFGKGVKGLGKPIVVPLPPTEIDLKTLAPQLPGSLKMTIRVTEIARKGGYGAFTLALQ